MGEKKGGENESKQEEKKRGGRKIKRKSVVLATHQQCLFQIPFFSSSVPTLQSLPQENLKGNNISEEFYRLADSVIRDQERKSL